MLTPAATTFSVFAVRRPVANFLSLTSIETAYASRRHFGIPGLRPERHFHGKLLAAIEPPIRRLQHQGKAVTGADEIHGDVVVEGPANGAAVELIRLLGGSISQGLHADITACV